jgi:hypothetical protein
MSSNTLVKGLFPITWGAIVEIANYLTGICQETKIIRQVVIEILPPLGSDKAGTESRGSVYKQREC